MTKSEVKAHLDEILKSKTFAKSSITGRLLSYLVEHSLEKNPIKEYTINQEFFHKADDGNTRVYVHNLRKKLQEYYQSEGAKSKIRFTIPKGRYKVEFKPATKYWQTRQGKTMLSWMFSLTLVFVIISMFFLLTSDTDVRKVKKSDVWHPFLTSKEDVLVVLGDHFFFTGDLPTGETGILRNSKTNSLSDFEQLQDSTPQLAEDYQPLHYSYMTRQGPYCLHKVMPYLDKVNEQFKLSSELTNEDIRNYHILYFGSYKSLGLIQNILEDEYYSYSIDKNLIRYYDSAADSLLLYRSRIDGNERTEYPIVLKSNTAYDKMLLAFMSINDAGNMGSLNYFLNPDSLDRLVKKIHIEDKHDGFKALFAVESLNRTDMSVRFLKGERFIE